MAGLLAAFGGKSKVKAPEEVAKHLKDSCQIYEKSSVNQKAVDKATEEVSKDLAAMKIILYGEENKEPNPDTINSLMNAIFGEDLLPLLVTHLTRFEFEAKKDVASIFNNILRRQVSGRFTTVEYLQRNPIILLTLVRGYETQDIALNCGSMLRECIRHESLAKVLLYSDEFYKFFLYVAMSNFDVASDGFATFKDLLTKHKTICAEFLEKNYDKVFEHYTGLLNSTNYVTRRQSIKLLGELLLDRANFNIMTKYISSKDNLKLMMILLRDESHNIQYEAFHVFKVFVANPNKTKPILDILLRNKEKLISFLNNFRNDKEDEQFNEEKAFLLKQIAQLQPTG